MNVKMLLLLSFVHIADVINAFDQFTDECPDELQPLVDHWEDDYIGRRTPRGNPKFAVAVWSIYNRVVNDLPRTNNLVQVWHKAFQQTVDCHHPSIFKLIKQFRKEQDHAKIQLEKFNSGECQPEASKCKYRQLSQSLKNIVETYADQH